MNTMQTEHTNMEEKRSKYSFDLNEIEIQRLDEFRAQVPAKQKNEHNLELSFKLGVGGIGIGITARIGAYSWDITDYDRW